MGGSGQVRSITLNDLCDKAQFIITAIKLSSSQHVATLSGVNETYPYNSTTYKVVKILKMRSILPNLSEGATIPVVDGYTKYGYNIWVRYVKDKVNKIGITERYENGYSPKDNEVVILFLSSSLFNGMVELCAINAIESIDKQQQIENMIKQ